MNTTTKKCPVCTFYHDDSDVCYRKLLYSIKATSENYKPKSTTKITWRCPDCNGNHTTTEDRKYYCTLLVRW